VYTVYAVNLCVLSVSCGFSNEFESFVCTSVIYSYLCAVLSRFRAVGSLIGTSLEQRHLDRVALFPLSAHQSP
jgi:hypothetical protein